MHARRCMIRLSQCMQITMEWLHWTGQWHKYRHFILLNSSVRGPFYPSYMGPSWQWTRAFTDRLVGNVKLVSSSLVCLPEVDAGGLGPKVGSLAFASCLHHPKLTRHASSPYFCWGLLS